MESPVVLDKPPEYHGNERGFPFDEEEGTGAWSELAARHPDIAARLRQRPATWARKRRPSSQDGIDDTADSFGGFDRFPFDDIPPEFREHFPSHWNRRFGPRDEQFQQPPSPQPQSPQQQTTATQTEQDAGPSQEEQTSIPQYGLRNTVDLGQKSPADPSIVDADERTQRSMSAPPDHFTVNPNYNKMSGQNQQDQHHHPEHHSNVRHIPIFVEGRDEPVINKSVDHGSNFAETKPTYVPPPQPHIDREQYFADDGPPTFTFSKNFDRPFFRQPQAPFTKQKMYPQAFARGGSPQRSQSPKPQSYHEQTMPRPETPSRSQQKQPQQQQKQSPPQQKPSPPQNKQTPPQQRQPQSPPRASQRDQTPPPQPPPQQQVYSNDPVQQILTIQADVLNLMTEVENFKGTKKDKHYIFLDEMLTRNLIKLDNIETDGKENIRQERKEVIKCIQKCIAVLEAKAENRALATPPPQDVEMQVTSNETAVEEQHAVQNGDVDMKETTKDEQNVPAKLEQEPQQENTVSSPKVQTETEMKEVQKLEETKNVEPQEDISKNQSEIEPKTTDTKSEEIKRSETTSEVVTNPEAVHENVEKKQVKKTGKKRDKSKENEEACKDSKNDEVNKTEDTNDKKDDKENVDKKEGNENYVNKDVKENKTENVDNKEDKAEVMQVDAKGDSKKPDSQAMEVDSAASQ